VARAAACAAALLVAACAGAQDGPYDLMIEGGLVHDGSGAPGRVADVAVAGDRIAFVGDAAAEGVSARRTIDAQGLVVAPGFIDPHTHADRDLLAEAPDRRRNDNYLFQGVTTVFIGNDGGGPTDIADRAAELADKGTGPNVAFWAGFGYLRETIVGEDDRAPSPAEMRRMEEALGAAMCAGAVGLSSGLHYAPQNFATTDEIAALATVAGRQGGHYDTHLRDESSYGIGLVAAVDEALDIGRRSGAGVHLAHIKALGPDVWGQSREVIAAVEAAQAAGQSVTADQYPWRASGTRISNALVPRWALDGGLDRLRERLADAEARATVRGEMVDNLRRRAGPDAILLTSPLGDNADGLSGMTLAEAAGAADADPVDFAIEILMAGDYRIASFNMHEDDIRAFAARPWVMTASDGSTGHPRKFGTYPMAFQTFVTDWQLFDMAHFVRRSSGLVADTFGLADRGYVRAGMAADLVVFDPDGFRSNADYRQPEELSSGVRYLVVNGKMAIEEGRATTALAGRPLLKTPAAPGLCEE
jgi:N-acyl-D-aspartate/D-glutamate deacylase